MKLAGLFTGSGKTLIAVLLIKDKIHRMKSQGLKKSVFFLAPKVELVKQVSTIVICYLC